MRAERIAIALALGLALLAGCDDQEKKADKEKTEKPGSQLVLSSEDVEQLGIRTSKAQQTTFVPDIRGYGAVVSFERLAQAEADLATAQAAARQSHAALAHNAALAADKLITREALGVAERQTATDDAQALLAERKMVAGFGRDAPWHAGDKIGILGKLSSGQLALVHVTIPADAPAQKAGAITIERVGHPNGPSWKSTSLWEAPADPTLPGSGYFVLVANSDLAAGQRVIARMPTGAPVSGILIPADAAVLSGQNAWYYTQPNAGTFVRHPLDISRPVEGGYFVPALPQPGQPIVVQGASLLLAHELNPSSGDKD